MSSLLKKRIYRIMGMIPIGLYAFLNCEVLIDILRYYYPIVLLKKIFINPLYPLIVSILIMCLAYINGMKWLEGYIIDLKKSE
ncbi:MAG TPA: hypothetical protein GXZ78_08230 [Eubacteriaceae bacterium]|nr:hypothetical protein [Eubacteriaceae bacterium]